MTLTEYFVILEAVVFFAIAYLQQQRISNLERDFAELKEKRYVISFEKLPKDRDIISVLYQCEPQNKAELGI